MLYFTLTKNMGRPNLLNFTPLKLNYDSVIADANTIYVHLLSLNQKGFWTDATLNHEKV